MLQTLLICMKQLHVWDQYSSSSVAAAVNRDVRDCSRILALDEDSLGNGNILKQVSKLEAEQHTMHFSSIVYKHS